MKRLFCLLCFISHIVCGQTTGTFKSEPFPGGVYFNTGLHPLKGEIGQVERDRGQGFETIGNLSTPSTQAMLYQRMLNYALRFPNRYSVTEQLAANIWQMIQNGKQDSIQKSGIPVILLAMGGAFLDTAAHLPAKTRYRVQIGKRSVESASLTGNPEPAKINQIVFYELKPANRIIRAEWRLKLQEQPALLQVMRQRIGIDSGFTTLSTSLGFEKSSKGDSLRIHLSDSTAAQGINYLYFLAGKDFLGNTITRSDTIRSAAGNRATVSGISRLVTRAAADSSGIQLIWNKQNINAIRSVRVFRSPYYDSAYVQLTILPAADTSWTDRSAAIGANYYYQVVAQGNDDFSYPSPRVFGSFINNRRLLPPTSFRVSGTENNRNFTWKYHTYMDLLGFRVYRAQGNSGRFEAITDVIPAQRDSLQFSYMVSDTTIDSHQFYTYAVGAVSRNFKVSPLSATIQLNVIRTGKLTAPYQVRNLEMNDSTTMITWQDMLPIDRDISGYHVYRKTLGPDSIKGFKRLTAEPITRANEFFDTPGMGKAWQYVVRSVSGKDSSAYSLPVVVRLFGDKPLPPGKVSIFSADKRVMLNWDGTQVHGVNQYHIYRAAPGVGLTKIASVSAKATANSYEDTNPGAGSLFFYYVTAETTQHVESDRSQEVSIRLSR